jgi:ABC-type polysaccharide/polyol phosphate transport system ATPase subunit
MMRPAISLKGIGKKYRISPNRSSRLSEILSFGKAKRSREFWALQDVDLDIEAGTTLGVVGRNGAGKSTLLSIISGVLRPTTGEVEVQGRLSAIFGLGAGFNPLFTGRENAMLSGLILGIEYEEMLARFDEIEAFADIGEFMDQPIKTYSSGMRGRLGFAVAINVEPDVLVIDEALSAGDAAFKKKAIQRMYELRESGSTVLFVSHSMGMVKRFCTQAILLHKGRLLRSGSPEEVVDHYEELIANSKEMKEAGGGGTGELDEQLDYEIDHEDEEDTPTTKGDGLGAGRTKDTRSVVLGRAEIVALEVLDEKGQPVEELPSGATLTVRVHLRYDELVEDSTLAISVHSQRAGVEIFSTDTALEGVPLGRKDAGEQATVDFTFGVPLGSGVYNVGASLTDPQADGSDVARTQTAATFEITQEAALTPARGLVHLPANVEIHGLEGHQERPGRPA